MQFFRRPHSALTIQPSALASLPPPRQAMILRYCSALLIAALLSPLTTAAAPNTPQAAEPTSANDGPSFPIWAWIGIPAEHASVERYRELADAGFTVTFDSA